MAMTIIFTIILGYFIGSIPTALIASTRRNIDIRKHGSGNIGGTNTFRVLGKKAGFMVSIIDILKGLIPTLIAMIYGGEILAVAIGISACIGHSFSIFAKFKGGKSVATSAGVMLVLNPYSILVAIVVFATVLFLTKYVSLSSMLAAVSVFLYITFFESSFWTRTGAIFLVLFIIARHHTNIKRLFKGAENKAFQKKS